MTLRVVVDWRLVRLFSRKHLLVSLPKVHAVTIAGVHEVVLLLGWHRYVGIAEHSPSECVVANNSSLRSWSLRH